MANVKSKSGDSRFGIFFCWALLLSGALCLLFYGLSVLLAAPTVETVTTNSPAPANAVAVGSPPNSDENDHLLRSVKFRGAKKH